MVYGKAEDAGGLSPAKDDNAAVRHFIRRTLPILDRVDYIYSGKLTAKNKFTILLGEKKMRRSDREVKELNDIVAIMQKCDVCRIVLNNDGYPYILPLNFGMYIEGNKIELYFHGAMEGTKYALIEKDNRASFEMDCEHELITEIERGNCTMAYESVIGQGHIEILPDDEKYQALCILMKHYHQEDFPFDKSAMPRTRVFKLVVENITGKVRMKKTRSENHL